mmetsp:Transcript_17782/g.41431  ORF Transcript_17782/g.41431 Transcript_17782/m.41431 type:complete len:235 (+) Transcript_17782:478-1182(+)
MVSLRFFNISLTASCTPTANLSAARSSKHELCFCGGTGMEPSAEDAASQAACSSSTTGERRLAPSPPASASAGSFAAESCAPAPSSEPEGSSGASSSTKSSKKSARHSPTLTGPRRPTTAEISMFSSECTSTPPTMRVLSASYSTLTPVFKIVLPLAKTTSLLAASCKCTMAGYFPTSGQAPTIAANSIEVPLDSNLKPAVTAGFVRSVMVSNDSSSASAKSLAVRSATHSARS